MQLLIDLGCDKNELISMNDKVFKLKSETVENIIDEVISLIGNMYYGRKEDENFNNMLKKISFYIFLTSNCFHRIPRK